ncbi:hypothetical protein H8E88_18800 [candidate division KSB1 bacterium]|nr:hypothetical protein [candidate division KSB1 bacterium]MBL7093335.1 hypothetical protein [candidate division KSB1 bacterium]
MYTIYKMKATELDDRFLLALKEMYQNEEIEISVSEAGQIEEDETAYLLRSSANRERLLKAIDNVTQKQNLVTVG